MNTLIGSTEVTYIDRDKDRAKRLRRGVEDYSTILIINPTRVSLAMPQVLERSIMCQRANYRTKGVQPLLVPNVKNGSSQTL